MLSSPGMWSSTPGFRAPSMQPGFAHSGILLWDLKVWDLLECPPKGSFPNPFRSRSANPTLHEDFVCDSSVFRGSFRASPSVQP